MVIAGSQIEEISTGIEGKIFDFTNDTSNDYLRMFGLATSHDKLVQMHADMSTEDFLEFVSGAIVGYNYTDREVWFTRDDKTYSYVFSRGVWYKVRASGSSFVGDYPRQYLLKDGTLTDISTSDGLAQETMFLTRPLKFGIQGFKQLLRVVLRGNIHTSGAEKYAGIYVFGSKDGYKWVFLGGNEQTGTLRDIGTRVERIDCKYFRIGFVGALLPDSTLDYIEVEAQEKIGGKIR